MTRLAPDACMAVLRRIWPDADTSNLEILVKLSQGMSQAVQLADSGAADLYQVACAPCFSLHRWIRRHLPIYVQNGGGGQPRVEKYGLGRYSAWIDCCDMRPYGRAKSS